ncbi:MAG: hypothetical protein WBO59_01525 [Trichococcus flocculiformis]
MSKLKLNITNKFRRMARSPELDTVTGALLRPVRRQKEGHPLFWDSPLISL